jgi:hypothetical protein
MNWKTMPLALTGGLLLWVAICIGVVCLVGWVFS